MSARTELANGASAIDKPQHVYQAGLGGTAFQGD